MAGSGITFDTAFFNVLIHGFGFMLFFTAFQTSSGFQATVLKSLLGSDDIGFISLAIIYSVFAFFNFFAPSVVALTGLKWAMVACSALYALFIGSFLKPYTGTILGASALLGMAAAVLWTAQGSFLTQCTTNENRGLYSGIFWMLLQCSLPIGNVISIFIVKGASDVPVDTALLLYKILTGVACAGVVVLVFILPMNKKKSQQLIEDEEEDKFEVPRPSVWKSFVLTLKLMVQKDMLMLSVLIMYSGFELSFWSSKYATAVGGSIDPGPKMPSSFKPQMTGFSGLIVGCAEIIGGLTAGKIGDKFGRSVVAIFTLFFHAIAFMTIYTNMLSNIMTPNIYLALVCSFILGLGDSFVNNALYTILGDRFSHQSVQAFALFKLFQSLAAAAAFFYAGHLGMEYQMLILGVFLLAGTYCFVKVDKDKSKYQPGYQRIQVEVKVDE